MRFFTVIATLLFLHLQLTGSAKACPQGICENSWKTASKSQKEQAFDIGDSYKDFLFTARTELTTVQKTIALAEKRGFKPWQTGTSIKPGDKYYHNNRDRGLLLILGGKKPVSKGVRIVASHIDSPRLDLKLRPLYATNEFALVQTNYHGRIKAYQWTNVPLALVGRIDKKDGTIVNVSVGLQPDDPIFMITDLSPHVAKDQMKRSAETVISYEDLDAIINHGPDGKLDVLASVLAYLKNTYGVEQADLVSSELALVPAMPPRDMGLNRHLIAADGHDDRLGAYTSLAALFSMATPEQTAIILFADNEEGGNVNVTGASSSYLQDIIGELIYAETGDAYRQPMLARALRASTALSIDMNPGINPLDTSVWEEGNAPRLGYGVNIKAYGRGLNADSETTAWIRAAFDSRNIPWQTTTYKVGKAGGGTLGTELSKLNIDTIDFGAPVLSIHSPYGVCDKMDILSLKNAVQAFLEYNRP
ncbi:zinc-binding metallopeptidase family protein [Kordiimonas pumila]|uniref:M18 family aminopeptidase n=1 Tax=Kordiimonas pumila TaxID=2161677 RepID=A0ABV7D435_9PROT|nr:aminopeptidase 1 [Kordiimonas pumila]